MARGFTTVEKALLKSPDLAVNLLATFYLDEGTYRFCDEITGFDLFDGVNTYIGANTFADAVEIRMTSDMQAEQVTLLLDGNRLTQAGVADPARVLSDILGYLYQQRRVDFAFGFRYNYSTMVTMVVPVYAGKINSARLIDKSIDYPDNDDFRTTSQLEIVLDALAARYGRATMRLRAHNDQKELDSTDQFYSHTVDVAMNERTLYWGKNSPFGSGTTYPRSSSYGGGLITLGDRGTVGGAIVNTGGYNVAAAYYDGARFQKL